MLAPHGAGGIVLDPDRQAESGVDLVADPYVDEAGQVGADAQHALPVDEPGDAHPDGGDRVLGAQDADDVGHGVEQWGGADGRRHARLGDDVRRVEGIEHDPQHLGAADVDARHQAAGRRGGRGHAVGDGGGRVRPGCGQ